MASCTYGIYYFCHTLLDASALHMQKPAMMPTMLVVHLPHVQWVPAARCHRTIITHPTTVTDESQFRTVIDESQLSTVIDESKASSVANQPQLSTVIDESQLSTVIDESRLVVQNGWAWSSRCRGDW